MRYLTILLLLVPFSTVFAQPNTEVHLVDITTTTGQVEFSNPVNISDNEGYDNQPSFYDDKSILFSSTRNGQTDIAKYDIANGQITWITNTANGSEYSPLRIPNSTAISAIRLDTNGLQRLYRYDSATGQSQGLLKDLKVGYHVWYNDHILVTTVLVENRMDLVVSNLKDQTNYTVQKNVGRSLHKIPNSDLISYVSKEKEDWEIKSLHPISGATEFIINTSLEVEDLCWLHNGTLLMGKGNTLLQYHAKRDTQWGVLHRFENENLANLSRLSTNATSTKLALVSEVSNASIVQKQVDSYNARDLEAFVLCYAEDVIVSNFPNDTLYVGRAKMRNNYKGLSTETEGYQVEVTKRIQIGNKVIDQEKVTGFGKTSWQAAIYEVANGTLASMTFIHDKKVPENPEIIVQQQLDAYNARNIDAFVATYSDDVKVFNFPNEMSFEGTDKMREGYAGFFENTPDLNCKIITRMVVGNIVIDEEYLTINGQNYPAVAIYEVEDGKIAKVTFVR